MIERLGLAFYYLTRIWTLSLVRFWRWTLGAYLTRKSKRCGSVRVNGYGRFVNVWGLSLGNNVHINFGANWMCDGGLSIGDNVHISSNCTIYTRNHNSRGKALPYDDENIPRPVSIGRNTWIGVNVTIVPGTQIGHGVIVGAGAVVHGRVPDFTILGASAPATVGERDRDHYDNLESKRCFGGPNGRPITQNGR